jgi:hypothetical protein
MSRQERSSQTYDNQPPRHDVIDAKARRLLQRRVQRNQGTEWGIKDAENDRPKG